jgi:uncharacterized protein YlxP (DUF503 family)
MIVGVLTFEIFIPSSESLKEKRFVLKSLKDRLKNKFNVSVAEIGFHDKWQRAEVGVAMIGNDQGHVQQSLQQIFQYIDNSDSYEILSYQFDYA